MRILLSLLIAAMALQARASSINYSRLNTAERADLSASLTHYLVRDRTALSIALHNVLANLTDKQARMDVEMSRFTLKKFGSAEAVFEKVGRLFGLSLGDFAHSRGNQTISEVMTEIGRADALVLHLNHGPEDVAKYNAFLDSQMDVRDADPAHIVVVVKGFERHGLCELVAERRVDATGIARVAVSQNCR